MAIGGPGIPKRPVKCGETFGRLLVIEEESERAGKHRAFLCRCDCGQIVRRVRGGDLRSGKKPSCGCQRKELVGNRARLHGHRTLEGSSPTYQSWLGMRQRCLNPRATGYQNWGGRGVTICERWSNFENFLADMGERPEGFTLDRIDNDGNYEPGNCRWATRQEQQQNRRLCKTLTKELS
jgi:hypothetical protein